GYAGAGHDTAFLYDSGGDDIFVGTAPFDEDQGRSCGSRWDGQGSHTPWPRGRHPFSVTITYCQLSRSGTRRDGQPPQKNVAVTPPWPPQSVGSNLALLPAHEPCRY